MITVAGGVDEICGSGERQLRIGAARRRTGSPAIGAES